MVKISLRTARLLTQAILIPISICAVAGLVCAFDVNGDGKEGLAEAIHALQVVAGIIPIQTPVGDAEPADVLVGKIFSNSADTGLEGSMPKIDAEDIVPGVADINISEGYHDGTGTVAGDPDLVTGNIKSGVSIFNVPGSVNVVDTSDGDADVQHILNAKIAYVSGTRVVGQRAYIYGCHHGIWDLNLCLQDCYLDTLPSEPACDGYCNATATNMIVEISSLCQRLSPP